MKIRNSFKELTKFECILWIISLFVVSASCLMSKMQSPINCIASLVGVTALIFVSKGDVFGQFLTVAFSVLYAISAYEFRYYGEMITYMGMTAPMAVVSVVSWLKHPYENSSQVKIEHLRKGQIINIVLSTLIITIFFYFILKYFSTPNLIVSTISIATSFSASYLTYLRSLFYAAAYSLNDIVLIVLWIMASFESISYLPMAFCFFMFLINDIYGFYNWGRMKNIQENI